MGQIPHCTEQNSSQMPGVWQVRMGGFGIDWYITMFQRIYFKIYYIYFFCRYLRLPRWQYSRVGVWSFSGDYIASHIRFLSKSHQGTVQPAREQGNIDVILMSTLFTVFKSNFIFILLKSNDNFTSEN